jgi:hypothetical protein
MRTYGMNLVEIKVHGAAREPLILELSPVMTAADLLAEADLAGYALVREAEPMKLIPPEMVLFDLLTDCETLYARAPVKIDSDEAREDLKSLLEVDDDPPSEPMDTSEDDAYIRSWFKEEDEEGNRAPQPDHTD